MDSGTPAHLATLKAALQTLKDSGADGFEGLLAAVLSDIGGQPFRIASSGTQRGRDGDSAFDEGATYFEAKLYEGAVPAAAVNGKIVDLANDDKGQVDLWILCATGSVNSQHAERYRGSLARLGIGCLILDWPRQTLPPLAVLLAMAAPTVERFILDYSLNPSAVTGVRGDLDAVAVDSRFSDFAAGLRSSIREGTLGLGLAKAANRSFFVRAFSDRGEARVQFGQPLAPLDGTGLAWAERPVLVGEIQKAFSGPPDDHALLVLGDEGTGKSWLVAKGWFSSQPSPLLTVFMASELTVPEPMSMEPLIIAKLAAQAGDHLSDAVRARWARRFKGWRANPGPANVRLVVWVDGLNQASGVRWHRWIAGLTRFLNDIGGRLVVTTNSWHYGLIRSAIVSRFRRILVDEWSDPELKTILDAKGVRSDVLAPDVFDFLRNPRILGIAIELLDAREIERIDELTVERLLFEHIMRHDRDAIGAVSAREFVATLREHAQTILDRLAGQEHDDITAFQLGTDLKAVSQSRFFEPVSAESDLYAVRKTGLPLALGLALASALRKEERGGRDPAARLAQVTEPINALAETSAVVFSALQVSCLQEDCPTAVIAALVRYFVGLQNVSDELWPAFQVLAKSAPVAFLQATHDAAFSRVRLPNARWLIVALHAASADPARAAEISRQAQEWLRRYSLAPERATFSRPDRDPKQEADDRERLKEDIAARISSLTEREKGFLDATLIESSRHDLATLQLYALELLSGKPLANAVPALVGWAFSNVLNADVHRPDKQFRHLIRFNAIDWLATRDAIRLACEPFLLPGASPVGRRTAAVIL